MYLLACPRLQRCSTAGRSGGTPLLLLFGYILEYLRVKIGLIIQCRIVKITNVSPLSESVIFPKKKDHSKPNNI